jgi:AcrR family transcriptional regulator
MNSKRRYISPKRERQAEETRRTLAASARRLFTQQGYGATSIESIARGAGVAVQTFYATYGSKRAVLLALLDEVEAEADLLGLLKDVEQDASDPRRQLMHVTNFNIRLFQRGADVLEILRSAGGTDPDLAAVWREGEERRRKGQASFIREWARNGTLRPGLEQRHAADILWVLSGPDTYRAFVTERRWPISRYKTWLTATLEQVLFGA